MPPNLMGSEGPHCTLGNPTPLLPLSAVGKTGLLYANRVGTGERQVALRGVGQYWEREFQSIQGHKATITSIHPVKAWLGLLANNAIAKRSHLALIYLFNHNTQT